MLAYPSHEVDAPIPVDTFVGRVGDTQRRGEILPGRTIRKYTGSSRLSGIWPDQLDGYRKVKKKRCIRESHYALRAEAEIHDWFYGVPSPALSGIPCHPSASKDVTAGINAETMRRPSESQDLPTDPVSEVGHSSSNSAAVSAAASKSPAAADPHLSSHLNYNSCNLDSKKAIDGVEEFYRAIGGVPPTNSDKSDASSHSQYISDNDAFPPPSKDGECTQNVFAIPSPSEDGKSCSAMLADSLSSLMSGKRLRLNAKLNTLNISRT